MPMGRIRFRQKCRCGSCGINTSCLMKRLYGRAYHQSHQHKAAYFSYREVRQIGGSVMEQAHLAYKNLAGLLQGQRQTLLADILTGLIERYGHTVVPCELVFWEDRTVIIIYSLDYVESAEKPLVLRRHDWRKPWWETALARKKPRYRMDVIDANGLCVVSQRGTLDQAAHHTGTDWRQVVRPPKAS